MIHRQVILSQVGRLHCCCVSDVASSYQSPAAAQRSVARLAVCHSQPCGGNDTLNFVQNRVGFIRNSTYQDIAKEHMVVLVSFLNMEHISLKQHLSETVFLFFFCSGGSPCGHTLFPRSFIFDRC